MSMENNARWQTARVVESRTIADGIRRIVLETDRGCRIAPGAHIDVKVAIGDRREMRSYSIVEGSEDGKRLTISVFLSPQSRGGASFMHGLEVDDRLEISEPSQTFPLRIQGRRTVLLAGGVGITAIFGMAAALKAAGADYLLVYVGRSRKAMAFLSELGESHSDRLRVHIDDEGTGLDVPALIREVAEDGDGDTEIYVCGPITLMDAARRNWSSLAMPISRFRFETFGSSGWFEAEPFVVKVPRLGMTAEVGRDQTLLEALERAGADMMWECRKGECGLCQVQIVELDGQIDHRDVFFSDEEKTLVRRLCTCVSRAVHVTTAPASDAQSRDERVAVLTLDLP